ncbi:mechanosensitive ion channel [Trichothermofontia sichuanensis B231]|uniref:mechanosensitive ion channel domain-containing protein n=1 Tax=Trichothermofontia sichuanensis TaxID=3045816 RepID=UPI0022457179|nr:mechanosensitive ion channel domain-containing protein [Trichothermofontia sichuanensis]UZQ56213.1 mechanosensitive ion channel [Trichothermofontia sichuanensis B231]
MYQTLYPVFEQAISIFTDIRFTIGGTVITLAAILQAIFLFLIIIFLARGFKALLRKHLLSRLGIDATNREAIATIISYSLAILSFLIILQLTGINVASLAVIAGGLGIGVGFGLQSITKNFISGLTLLTERKLKVGDFIEFSGISGYVKEVSLRSTLIRTRDGGDVVVPNSELVENHILNWTYDSYIARIKVPVGVAYGTDPALVTETLLHVAYQEPTVVHDPAPRVVFQGFGDSSLNFELWVWVTRIDDEPFIKSALNFAIEYNLRQHQIAIPFPQRDLWIRNPEALSLIGSRQTSVASSASTGPSSPIPTTQVPALRDFLRQVPYFHGFSDLELRQLIEIGYRKRLQPSDILFRENDAGDAFYIVLSGSVEVFVEKLNKQLAILSAGQFFGELSLILGIPRTATVRALEVTTLFVINSKSFSKLLQNYPEFYNVIFNELCKHQKELEERQKQLRELGLLNPDEDDKNPIVWVRKRLKNLFNL